MTFTALKKTSPLDTPDASLTLDGLGQSQSPLYVPADGLETFLELLVTLVLLVATGIVAAVMLVAAFGHGRDSYIKLEEDNNYFVFYGTCLLDQGVPKLGL